MREKEIENVMKLVSFDRYKYFIKKIADFEELWTIVDVNGDYALSDVEEFTMLSFWPAEEFIISNLSHGWDKCKTKKLTFNDLDDIFDLIAEENYLINIFPIDGKTGFIVSLDEFSRDLKNELDKY